MRIVALRINVVVTQNRQWFNMFHSVDVVVVVVCFLFVFLFLFFLTILIPFLYFITNSKNACPLVSFISSSMHSFIHNIQQDSTFKVLLVIKY